MNKYAQHVEKFGGTFVYSRSEEAFITLTEEDLQVAEREIGYLLPRDYREFLKDFGGYTFDGVYYPIHGSWSAMNGLDTFYGLKIRSCNLLSTYKGDLANGVIAPDLLPITGDMAGGHVCLFIAGDRLGSIHYWFREEAVAPYDYSNLYHIANSFDEFMQSLTTEDEYEAAQE